MLCSLLTDAFCGLFSHTRDHKTRSEVYTSFKQLHYDTGRHYDILTLGIAVCVLWLEFIGRAGYDDNQTQVCVRGDS